MSIRLCARLAVMLLGSIAVASTAAAADGVCPTAVGERPRIGLVLGGGGARGIAHIGVIRMLEELNVPVDYVAGTSFGALVGGMYATGMTSDELQAVVEGIDWKDIFADGTARADRPYRRKRDDDLSLFGPKFGVGPNSSLLPKGAISGQKIRFLFESVTSQRSQTRDFDALPVPFRAIAANVITGEAVVIGDGDLATAMRASMSIPGLFDPIEYEDALLVDGGIAKNLPIDVVKSMGADIVIAVDVGTPLSTREELTNFVQITGQLTSILIQRNTWEQRFLLEDRDVLIVPDLGNEITSAGFEKATEEAMPIGYAAAEKVRDRLAALGVDGATYAAHRGAIAECVAGPPTIQFVRIDNRSRFRDSIIEERLHVHLGEPLDVARMERDIKQIFALGFLETATYEVVEENGRKGVVVRLKQDSRGANFIETGLDLAGNPGSADLDVRLGFLKTDVDTMGSEFRTVAQVGENPGLLTEIYKPLDEDLRLIVVPRLTAQKRSFDRFDETGNRAAQMDVTEYGGGLALGREFGRQAALFTGYRRYSGHIKTHIGATEDNLDFNRGEWWATLTWDRLDDRYFPSSGTLASAEYSWSKTALGASEAYEQISSLLLGAHTSGRHTLLYGARYNTTMDNDAPDYALFRAGGLFSLSAYEPGELAGQHFGMALLGYRLRVVSEGFLPPYLGATLEYGNVAENRGDVFEEGNWSGNFYLGFRSPLGPLYVGWGVGEDDRNTYFLRIGSVVGASTSLE